MMAGTDDMYPATVGFIRAREDQSPQPIDFEGKLSVLPSKLLNLNQHSSDLFLSPIAGFSFT
jgi:hypothetical protein